MGLARATFKGPQENTTMNDPLARFARTGRTTRATEEAIKLAEYGYYVFFIIGTQRLMQVEERRILKAAAEKGLQLQPVGCGKIYVGGRGGSIQIMHVTSEEIDRETFRVRGSHPSCKVIVDPEAMERLYGAQLRAYHKYDEGQTDGA